MKERSVFGWIIGVLGLAAASGVGLVGLGDLGAVNAANAKLLCGAFVLLVIAGLLMAASSGSSES